MIHSKKSLIITLPPEILGGVGTKAKILADYLHGEGSETTIAYYIPFNRRSESNVSFWQFPFFRKPNLSVENAFGGYNCFAVGCYFPELESSYSAPSSLWDQLIKNHDLHFVVGGTPVLANILEELNTPSIVWCGSDVVGDRLDRQRKMPVLRKFYDKKIITPSLLLHQTRVVNGRARVLAVSKFTQRNLARLKINRKKSIGLLSIPTDISFFVPPKKAVKVARLGFAGRLSDPRKNPKLLFSVLAKVKQHGLDPELVLTGESSPDLSEEISRFKVSDCVFFMGVLDRVSLLKFYQSLDLFLIPSFQEGLAIVGIEAMACGVPVISTRCGGPESYIFDGKNGYLVDFNSSEMAEKVCVLIKNRDYRQNFSKAARRAVETEYGFQAFKRSIEGEIEQIWGEKNK